MTFVNSEIRSFDLIPITLYHWECDNPKAIVHIIHGMSEHAARYDHFATWLNSNNISVISSDLRGHGKTAGELKNVGHFATRNGWEKVCKDIVLITEDIIKKYPNLPIIFLGHSMGSFLLRKISYSFGDYGSGYIFSSTAGHPGLLGIAGVRIAKLNVKLMGKRNKSQLMTQLTFGDFNKKYKDKKTNKDWLSRNEDIVNQYINDPYCMQTFSSQFYNDLVEGLLEINQTSNIDKMNKDLPILLFAGDMDPVGNYGKGTQEVYDKMKSCGVKDIELVMYEQGRHEMLNEINKMDVYQMILNWIYNKFNL
ncbi:MAG: alpha/beta hydrolase [Crocinitomicaceae bacterium]|nr:alpha/beta hydrolase [Crocinitomicaceae bacterium]